LTHTAEHREASYHSVMLMS